MRAGGSKASQPQTVIRYCETLRPLNYFWRLCCVVFTIANASYGPCLLERPPPCTHLHSPVVRRAYRFMRITVSLGSAPSIPTEPEVSDRSLMGHLWSTDLYSGRWSYTTLWSRLFCLSHAAESDLVSRLVMFPSPDVYSITHYGTECNRQVAQSLR